MTINKTRGNDTGIIFYFVTGLFILDNVFNASFIRHNQDSLTLISFGSHQTDCQHRNFLKPHFTKFKLLKSQIPKIYSC